MTETGTGLLAVGGMLGLSASTFLYMLGGRSQKLFRRLGASFILSSTVNILCLLIGNWKPLLLLIYPVLILGFSIGYSADTIDMKLLRRSLYALCVCAAGFVCCLTLQGNAWGVLIFQIITASGSIYLGIRNPVSAAAEEVLVCASLNLGLIAYPFTVGVSS